KHLVELAPEEEKLAKEMTARGVSWLRNMQQADGSWPGEWTDGETALGGLTLLACGVDPKEECIQRAAARIRATGPGLKRTYDISTYLLFLDKLNDPGDQKLIRSLAYTLIVGQSSHGGWRYECSGPVAIDQEFALKKMDDLVKLDISMLRFGISADEERRFEE